MGRPGGLVAPVGLPVTSQISRPMTRMQGFFVLIFATICIQDVFGVVWVKGGGGSSCETVCSARGGCLEDVWPKTEEEFDVVMKQTGHTCVAHSMEEPNTIQAPT